MSWTVNSKLCREPSTLVASHWRGRRAQLNWSADQVTRSLKSLLTKLQV